MRYALRILAVINFLILIVPQFRDIGTPMCSDPVPMWTLGKTLLLAFTLGTFAVINHLSGREAEHEKRRDELVRNDAWRRDWR